MPVVVTLIGCGIYAGVGAEHPGASIVEPAVAKTGAGTKATVVQLAAEIPACEAVYEQNVAFIRLMQRSKNVAAEGIGGSSSLALESLTTVGFYFRNFELRLWLVCQGSGALNAQQQGNKCRAKFHCQGTDKLF